MKKHIVKLQMKATYEATMEIDAESLMEAYDAAKATISAGAVQATMTKAGELKIISVAEVPQD